MQLLLKDCVCLRDVCGACIGRHQAHVGPEETERDNRMGREPEQNSTQMAGSRPLIAPTQSPDPPAPPIDESEVVHCLRYPLNSKRLTAAHLGAIAEAIGLPTGGSVDQFRQCIEGKLQTERNVTQCHHYHEGDKDYGANHRARRCGGQICPTPPLRRGHAPDESTTKELRDVHAQLQEAKGIIDSAQEKDTEQAQQIAELHDALRKQGRQMTMEFEDKVADLNQRLQEEKAKLRQSWKTS